MSTTAIAAAVCQLALVASLVFGGATRSGFFSDAMLQAICIPLLLIGLWTLRSAEFEGPHRLMWGFWAGLFGIQFAQLIPLPPTVWRYLPLRSEVTAALGPLGFDGSWQPVSVAPTATALALLSLIPPFAIFIAAIQTGYRQRRSLTRLLLAFAVFSVFLGLAQVSQGEASRLRPFSYTNTADAVGLFANRNHLAALIYSVLLIAFAWLWAAVNTIQTVPAFKRHESRAILWLLVAAVVVLMLLAGQVMTRSRAGLGLTILALLGAVAVAASDRRSISDFTRAKLVAGISALVIVGSTQYALFRVIERFADDPLRDARIPFARNGIAAAKAFMPFGSGVGTFVPVYGLFEKPGDVLIDGYANRVHDDILEFWIEAGAPALGLMVIFLLWFGFATWRTWREAGPAGEPLDHALARAASVGVGLILLHSFVDYPLRTNAMMAVMASMCALLVRPPAGVEEPPPAAAEGSGRTSSSKKVSRKSSSDANVDAGEPADVDRQHSKPSSGTRGIWPPPPSEAVLATTDPVADGSTQPGQKWGQSIAWPAEWQPGGQPSEPPGPKKSR